MPRVAARLNVGLASDCTQLAFEGSFNQSSSPCLRGQGHRRSRIRRIWPQACDGSREYFSVPKPDASKSAEVDQVTADLGALKTKVTEVVKGTSARPM